MSAIQDIPRIRLSQDGPLPDLVREQICHRFAEVGVMHFEQILTPDHVSALHLAYEAKYAAYHRDMLHDDALHVGDRRNMITVTLAGPFNDPLVYANPSVMPVLEALLDYQVRLGSFVSVTSLPGAKDQEPHLDMPLLFEDESMGTQLPSYCLTLVVPLVPMNAQNGTTAYYPASHLTVSHEHPESPPALPEVPIGDALLFDCRVWHGGTENRSDAPRPVLYNTYQRPWFRDQVNFGQQEPLIIPQTEWDHVPEEHRLLLEWCTITE